jgi:hypothetical protein
VPKHRFSLIAVAAVCAAVSGMPAASLQPQPAARDATPLAPADARAAALRLADLLASDYVEPGTAERYAAMLREKANRGGYDRLTDRAELAQALTADLQAVAPDNHLRVSAIGGGGSRPRIVMVGPGGARSPGMPAPIEETRLLAPGVAYIRFNEFSGDQANVAAAERFMAENAGARTIIFDLRTHRGGGLAEMDAMLPYLYARPTRLLTMDTRGSVERASPAPFDEGPTLRRVPVDGDVVRREHVVEPHPSERRLYEAQVFVLTSPFTASAAEHFALALRRTGRATLIGERTAGAGNYGGMRPIGAGLAAFVPVGMTRDPETGARWEANGIEPHVAVPAEQALVEALARSGLGRGEAERVAATVRPSGPMRRPNQAG